MNTQFKFIICLLCLSFITLTSLKGQVEVFTNSENCIPYNNQFPLTMFAILDSSHQPVEGYFMVYDGQDVLYKSDFHIVVPGDGVADKFYHEYINSSELTIKFLKASNDLIYGETNVILNLMPNYKIDAAIYSCDGTIKTEVNIIDTSNDLSFVWFDGKTDKYRDDLAPGKYELSISSSNGCVDLIKVNLENVSDLKLSTDSYVTNCNGQSKNITKIGFKNGYGPFTITTEDGQIFSTNNELFLEGLSVGLNHLAIVNRFGCEELYDINVVYSNTLFPIIHDVNILPRSNIDGNLNYKLTDAESILFGDLDGDGEDGTIFNVEYYFNDEDAMNGSNKLSEELSIAYPQTIVAKVNTSLDCYVMADVQLMSMPNPVKMDFLDESDEICEHEAPRELVLDSQSNFPLGGVFSYSGCFSCQHMENPVIDSSDNKYYFNPKVGSGIYSITYTYTDAQGDIVSIYDILAVQALTFGFLANSNFVCNSSPPTKIDKVPSFGGQITGTGVEYDAINNEYYFNPSGLSPGIYELEFSYEGNFDSGYQCPNSVFTNIEVFSNPQISITTQNLEVCQGDEVILSYEYLSDYAIDNIYWTRPDGSVSELIDLVVDSGNLNNSGAYTITLLDENGCQATSSAVLEIYPLPVVNCIYDPGVSCSGFMDATASVLISSGQGPFDFLWSDGQTNQSAVGLGQGIYNVTITDGNNCTIECSVNIDEPDPLVISSKVLYNVSCYEGADAIAEVEVMGGITFPPDIDFNYEWSNGVTESINNFLTAGRHYVTVTDYNGCIIVDSVDVTEPPPLSIDIESLESLESLEYCIDFTHEVELEIEGGTASYVDFQWELIDSGTTTATSVNLVIDDEKNLTLSTVDLVPGVITVGVKITDSNGCDIEDHFQIQIVDCFDLAISKYSDISSSLYPGDTISFDITVYNQGKVDAFDLVIEDILPFGLVFDPILNNTAATGNSNDWHLDNGKVVTVIDFLEAMSSVELEIKLIIDQGFTETEIQNNAMIISYSNGEVILPRDEDDAINLDNEIDNEIDDDSIGGIDDIGDEDKVDFENIYICQILAEDLEIKECLSNYPGADQILFSLQYFSALIDGYGDGDGDDSDGDFGAYVNYYNTYEDALNTSNEIFQVFCASSHIVYARVSDGNGCFDISKLDLVALKLQEPITTPEDVEIFQTSDVEFCFSFGSNNYNIQWQEFIDGQWEDLNGEISNCLEFEMVEVGQPDRNFRVWIEGDVEGEICSDISEVILLKSSCFPVACNDHINLSISDLCELIVTPDMLTEGSDSQTTIVKITDENGNDHGDKIGPHLLGQLLKFEVTETCDGSKCWGTLTVEDKYINPIDCEDVTLECNDPIEPGVVAPFPALVDYEITLQSDGSYLAVKEEICDTVYLTYHDDIEVLTCHEELSRIITRHWYANDPYGNSSECVQTISIERIFIGDITPPSNYDGFDEDAFYCDDDLDLDNVPGPNWNGMDVPDICHNFNIIYDDTRFDICPGSYKIHREWTLIDWCTQEILVYEQIIKIEPREPLCKEPRNLETVTSGYECTADYKVPSPDFENPCNVPYTYTIRWASFNEGLQAFNQPTTSGITGNQNSGYTINGLPKGKSRIYYRIEDACNKISNCYDNVTVNDETSPNAIAKEFITTTLGITAWTRVYAESINEGSHDNCAIEKIEVARMDDLCYPQNTLVFRDFVEFCCADVGNMAMVVMRVTDTSGNNSEVMVEVQVQNKIIPELECPGTYVIECTDHAPSPDISGWPVATNVDAFCPQFLIEYNDNVSLNDCGIGSINRHFYYRDGETGEILVDCYQTINVVDSNPFDENDIDWPSNTELTGCLYDLDPESPNSPVHGPDISDQQCALIAVEYSDQVFEDVAVACGKVLRTWTVIDWCQFEAEFPDLDPNQNGVQDGIWSQTQTIALYNNQAPEITNCSSSKIFIPGYGECEESVTMTREATDDCVDPELLTWSYEIDLGNDGSFEPSYSGSSNTFTRTLPFGEHRVVWIVSDPCNNRDICEEVFEVYDDKAPTPVCLSEIVTVVLGEDNFVEIWAVDFEASSFDNCSQYLYYSFSPNVNDDRRSFDCTDIPEGQSEIEIPLEMWVTDGVGLQDFCIVTMVLQNNNVEECDYSLTDTDVTGRVSTEMEEVMENVKVELLDNSGVMIMEGQTDAEGNYAFNDVPMYNDYTLSAEKNDDVLNGVSTLDIVLMQKHVLGVKALDSPYKLLAADVDGNQTVSAIDLINLRKVILGIVEYFPNDVESWMFIDANIQFEDPNQPWYQNYMPTMSDIESNSFGKNLMGIKVGDVNNSVVANMTSNVNIENRSSKKMLVGFDHDATEEKKIPVYIDSESAISGFQFNLTLGQAVGSVKVLPGSLILNQNNYNYTDNGLTISHSTAVGISISEDEPAFYIQYSGIWDSNIELTSHIIVAEAYDDDLNIMAVELRDSGLETNELMSEFSVTLSPNPVVDFAIIDFETAYSGQMSLNIYNQTGQRVYETIISHEGGQSQLSVNTTDMSAGLYFYELRAGVEVYKSKMLIMK